MKAEFAVAAVGAALISTGAAGQNSPTPPFEGRLGKTPKESVPAFRDPNPEAQEGARNVIWILLDDVGFAGTSSFGGLIDTPVFDSLAAHGLRFNNFHTTALSAPSRAALLTGCNHHTVHVGDFNTDTAGFPGYDTYMPMERGTIAEILQENGYGTFAVGKYNFIPSSDAGNAGPFNRWPTQRGFDHYFGFNPATACDDQWHPTLYRDTQRDQEDTGELAITRFADEAMNYIADLKTASPDKPFFLYFAPGTAHRPLQTTKEWIARYKGRFDGGWDEYARKTLERQKAMGLVPKDVKLPPRNKDLDRWKDLSPAQKKVMARQMEVYAGFVSQADHEIGRIVDYLRRIGELDNTIIFVITGDNGPEAQGRKTGVPGQTDPADMDKIMARELENFDRMGDESTNIRYAEGWAAATATPFRYYKGYCDYEGGTRNGLIVFAPGLIRDEGGIRSQYTHITDVLPTSVEMAGAKYPSVIKGYPQEPVEGISFAYAAESPDDRVASRRTSQYYELSGSYAMYKDGWKLQAPDGRLYPQMRSHGEPDTLRHLYHVAVDFNECDDVIAKYPEKAEELQKAFEEVAWKDNVYPLRGKAGNAPIVMDKDRTHFEILFGSRRWAEYPYFYGIEGRDYSLTAEVTTDEAHRDGVLFANDNFTFFMKDGVPTYESRLYYGDVQVKAASAVPEGKATVKAVVRRAEGKTSEVTIFVDGKEVARGNVGAIRRSFFSWDFAPLQIGRHWGHSFSADYDAPFVFDGDYERAYIDMLP